MKRPGFHADGGSDLLSTAIEYGVKLQEACSVLQSSKTGRFHVVRHFDVQRRITELGWTLYATLTVTVSVEYHLPDKSI